MWEGDEKEDPTGYCRVEFRVFGKKFKTVRISYPYYTY